jgi:2-dehydro-3-deoxyphosphogluconate aldolase/(4S)-4-hydroxy-2-oxoglutarate aldolase
MSTLHRTRERVVEKIGHVGTIVIMRRLNPDLTLSVVDAIVEGGIDILEITLDSPSALETITSLRKRTGEHALVGAGTVCHQEDAIRAIDAGAQFIVAPNTNPEVISWCNQVDVLAIPGALTPTEITNAVDLGASLVKIFPARAVGPNYIADVLAPLSRLKLVPTGGISLDNAGDYIKSGGFAIGIGSSLVGSALVEERNWAGITEAAQQLANIISVSKK